MMLFQRSLSIALLMMSGGAAAVCAQAGAPEPAPASAPAQNDPAAMRAAAKELMRLGRRDEAIATLKTAYAADQSLESALDLYHALAADDRLNDALSLLDEAAKKHSKQAALHVAYADGFARQAQRMSAAGAAGAEAAAQYEEAARSMETAMELEPKVASHHAAHIRYLLYATKTEEAVEAAAKSRAELPNSWEAALWSGEAIAQNLAYQGRLRAANLGENASDAEKAAEKERVESIAAAQKAFTDASSLDPKRAEPHERLGAFLLLLGTDRAKALEQYLTAFELDPAAVDIQPAIKGMSPKELLTFTEDAIARVKKGRPNLAPDSPDDARLHWYHGFALYQTDNRKGAADAFGLAAKKDPTDPTARYYLGKIAYAEQDFAGAVKHFDTLAKKSPKDLAAVGAQDGRFFPMIQGLIGKILGADTGATSVAGGANIDTAIRFELTLLELDPKNSIEWTNLGLFYRDSNRPKEALSAYKKALDLSPSDPRVLNDTAVIYHYYLKTQDAEATRLYELSIEKAKALIESKGASAREKEDAKGALTDATTNLARLKAGNHNNN